MATKAPAFQFYAENFIGGTKSMSAAARGCYVMMLASSWSIGPIEDQPRAIAAAMCLSPFDPPYETLWAEIKPKWVLGPSGWTNAKLESVRAEQQRYRDIQSDKGKKSAASRKIPTEPQPEVNHGSTTVNSGLPETPEIGQPEFNSLTLAFDSGLSSSPSPVVQTEVQRERTAPSSFETRFEEMRQHLKAAAYAHIAEFPDCEDGALADAVKDAAAKLKIYDYTGRKITSVVNEVRGYLAKVSA